MCPDSQATRHHPRHGAERTADTCSLDRAPGSRKAEVVEVLGGAVATRQLARLGILVGAILHIQRTAPLGGPVLVETRGGTVAVGRSIARKVLVRLLP
jgi:Fe2+ transport system protein FeoA